MFFKYSLGLEELKAKTYHLYRSFIAEFVGIFFLNFFACGASTQANGDLTLIGLAYGLSVFTAAMAVGHISGCHINPAITVGFLAVGRLSLVRAIFYVIAQCTGSLLAVTLIDILTNEASGVGIISAHTQLHPALSALQGVFVEFFLAFSLVLVVFGVTDENKPDNRFLAPLAIGLTVTLGHLGTVTYTGSSINPARTLGTAVYTGIYDNHWVFWVGPILGGIVAAFLYTFVFAAPKDENEDGIVTIQKSMTKSP